MLRQCNKPFAPMSATTFCALSKALWARSADLSSVHGGLVCNAKGKNFENFAEEKKRFAEDISEDFSEDRRYHFCAGFSSIPADIFEIFAEDCFLLRSFQKFLPSGFFTLKPFPVGGGGAAAHLASSSSSFAVVLSILGTVQEPPTRTTCLKGTGGTPPICTAVPPHL